tara:strand:- start:70 stop:456 length:387 start_codon:yes stop_codon:yes gene_type:complete
MNGHSDAIDNEDFPFSEETTNLLIKHGYTNEEFEHPYVDERKEELAGFGEFTEATHESPTQEQQVLKWIETYGSITQREANIWLSVGRLSARIYNLIHRDGYDIDKKMITVKNQFGKKCSVAKYYIKN